MSNLQKLPALGDGIANLGVMTLSVFANCIKNKNKQLLTDSLSEISHNVILLTESPIAGVSIQ